MSTSPKRIFLCRHGETEWTKSGQHTGLTDIALTKKGEQEAQLLGKRLQGLQFAQVLTSPLKRALHTCALSGLSEAAQIDPDLTEWNYGKYEGLTLSQIQQTDPDWNIFTNGAPQGESLADMGKRVDRVLAKIESFTGDVALFSHGHFLRALAVKWLQLPLQDGRLFALSPASLSTLGFEHTVQVLTLWNDISHLQ